jgi:hypothetical protein
MSVDFSRACVFEQRIGCDIMHTPVAFDEGLSGVMQRRLRCFESGTQSTGQTALFRHTAHTVGLSANTEHIAHVSWDQSGLARIRHCRDDLPQLQQQTTVPKMAEKSTDA